MSDNTIAAPVPTPRSWANEANEPAPGSDPERDFFGKDGLSFGAVLDIVNPLQHIPLVSTLYRRWSGDSIGDGPRVLGGGLYGGPLGLVMSVVNLAIEKDTGADIGSHLVASVLGPADGAPRDRATPAIAGAWSDTTDRAVTSSEAAAPGSDVTAMLTRLDSRAALRERAQSDLDVAALDARSFGPLRSVAPRLTPGSIAGGTPAQVLGAASATTPVGTATVAASAASGRALFPATPAPAAPRAASIDSGTGEAGSAGAGSAAAAASAARPGAIGPAVSSPASAAAAAGPASGPVSALRRAAIPTGSRPVVAPFQFDPSLSGASPTARRAQSPLSGTESDRRGLTVDSVPPAAAPAASGAAGSQALSGAVPAGRRGRAALLTPDTSRALMSVPAPAREAAEAEVAGAATRETVAATGAYRRAPNPGLATGGGPSPAFFDAMRAGLDKYDSRAGAASRLKP